MRRRKLNVQRMISYRARNEPDTFVKKYPWRETIEADFKIRLELDAAAWFKKMKIKHKGEDWYLEIFTDYDIDYNQHRVEIVVRKGPWNSSGYVLPRNQMSLFEQSWP